MKTMENLEPAALIAILTIVTPAITMVLGAIAPAVLEGLATLRALDGMTRQPEAANDLRGTLIIAMALLESTAIYCLLICLVLLFANPVLSSFLSGG
jgi:F-type H+-transporting ATPase subunit c